jgi:hypothetical protein
MVANTLEQALRKPVPADGTACHSYKDHRWMGHTHNTLKKVVAVQDQQKERNKIFIWLLCECISFLHIEFAAFSIYKKPGAIVISPVKIAADHFGME